MSLLASPPFSEPGGHADLDEELSERVGSIREREPPSCGEAAGEEAYREMSV